MLRRVRIFALILLVPITIIFIELTTIVLKSIGLDDKWLQSGIRISLGPWLSNDQIKIIPEILHKALLSL